MKTATHDLARQLADRAEAVCRHYLSNGKRDGRYWKVGNVLNESGRSMFVRLFDSARGGAGKWTDAATGEHGDLLDIIRSSCGLQAFADVMAEARRFLALPDPPAAAAYRQDRCVPSSFTHRSSDSSKAALRLFAMSQPIQDTLAETYLHSRGITADVPSRTLRFHPRCYYQSDGGGAPQEWPAMLAAVTDNRGRITGIHRTWLQRDGSDKAPLATPRRAMGRLLGNGVRFGRPIEVLAVGEGIETMLSLRNVLPGLPMVAALSAAHLAAFEPPHRVRRLYIAHDRDPAGHAARDRLIERISATGLATHVLSSTLHDFNDDLRQIPADAMLAALQVQLAREDVTRYLTVPA